MKNPLRLEFEEYLTPLQGKACDITYKIKSLSVLIDSFRPDSQFNPRDLIGLGIILDEIAQESEKLYLALDIVHLPGRDPNAPTPSGKTI